MFLNFILSMAMLLTRYSLELLSQIYIVHLDSIIVFLLVSWCPYTMINESVQYNGGFLPGIILYYSVDPMRLT